LEDKERGARAQTAIVGREELAKTGWGQAKGRAGQVEGQVYGGDG